MVRTVVLVSTCLVASAVPIAASAAPVAVHLAQSEGQWQLLRDGQPYFVRGAGGGGDLDALAAAGGNSLRTWGAQGLDRVLADADSHGLTVACGIWLGQPRHGFRYTDPDAVAGQYEMVAQVVERYRDHPAVLLWGLGNEAEGEGDDAAYWSALNNLAALVHRLDPAHPTMTVIAELGGNKVRNLHRLCPEIDIVGINTYGGGPSAAQRYREAGGEKPFLLTEFGPPGSWESGRTPWQAPLEPTSTEKAEWYRRTYEGSVLGQPLGLGSYSFIWGWKQEATATWFGMLLPDGSRLGCVDTLSELWTGRAPTERCPEIVSLRLEGPAERDPSETLIALLEVRDPDGQALTAHWMLQAEQMNPGSGGDPETEPPLFPDAIAAADLTRAEVRLPADPGAYRLFVYVRDGQGGAATANVPILVKGVAKALPAAKASLPFVVYAEAGTPEPSYVPSGWMGNTNAIHMQEDSRDGPHAGETCVRCEYAAGGDWGGVVWQHPANDWGDQPGGWDLSGASRLTFWARGAKGGEVVTFQLGLLGPDKAYADTARAELTDVRLTAEWTQHTIDLTGKDLSRVKTGFAWIVAGANGPAVFYLDDIRYE